MIGRNSKFWVSAQAFAGAMALIVFGALSFLAAGVGQAQAACTITKPSIDPGTGSPFTSLQAAVDSPGRGDIKFKGQCDGDVFIRGFENVRIRGDGAVPSDAIINADGPLGVFVRGTYIRMSNLTIHGTGVLFIDGAFGNIEDIVVENTVSGFGVIRGSNVRLDRVKLDTTTGSNFSHGTAASVGENSNMRIHDSIIIDNVTQPFRGGALSVFRSGAATVRGNTTISGGSGPAIVVSGTSDLRIDSPPPPEGDGGITQVEGDIFVTKGSFADIRAASITGSITIRLKSALELGSAFEGSSGLPSDVTINGDINLLQDSDLVLNSVETENGLSLVTINGIVECADLSSGVTGTATGALDVRCHGFEGKDLTPPSEQAQGGE